jgi:hypothetical protein
MGVSAQPRGAGFGVRDLLLCGGEVGEVLGAWRCPKCRGRQDVSCADPYLGEPCVSPKPLP